MTRFSFLATAASLAGAGLGLYGSPALAAETPAQGKPAHVEAIAGSSLKSAMTSPRRDISASIGEHRFAISGCGAGSVP